MPEQTATPDISVAIPCKNEAAGIAQTVARVAAACGARRWEIILVDDGSTDGTWEEIRALAAARPGVRGLRLARNFGQQAALTAALEAARGSRVLILDADLQDPPELLDEMWERMDAGFDVVYGQRTSRNGETAAKKLTARLFYRVFNSLSDYPIPEDAGDFRLMSRRAVDALLGLKERNRFMRGMMSWVGFPQSPLAYARPPRANGRSSYSWDRMIALAADGLLSFSTSPLRLAMAGGLGMAAGSLVGLGAIVGGVVQGVTVRGWASLMFTVMLFSSAQIVLVALVGEYVGRLLIEAKQRPVYVLREAV